MILVILVFDKQSHDYHHNCDQHYDMHHNHKHNHSHNHHHKDGGDVAAAGVGGGGVNDCGGDGNGGCLVFLVICVSKCL